MWVAIATVGCDGHESPTPPAVTGTLLCQPAMPLLSADAPLPDAAAATATLQREVVAQVTRAAFLHRVAVDGRFDEAVITRAVSARPVKDSRLVEVGVALPDRALATRVCDAILDHYLVERLGGGDMMVLPRHDVAIGDRCRPPRR
jgi:hypothetical protein